VKLPYLLDKMAAIANRDLLTAIRYRSGFALATAGTLAELCAFYYLSHAIGPGFRPDGTEYFPFLVVGTGFYTFFVMGVGAFLDTVQGAQQRGTLEGLMACSTSPLVLIFLSSVSTFAGRAVSFVLYLLAGLMVSGVRLHPNVAGAAVISVAGGRLCYRDSGRRAAVGHSERVGSSMAARLGHLVPDRDHVSGSQLAESAARRF
jgi:ABC-type multidrug transport system permease subunit